MATVTASTANTNQTSQYRMDTLAGRSRFTGSRLCSMTLTTVAGYQRRSRCFNRGKP